MGAILKYPSGRGGGGGGGGVLSPSVGLVFSSYIKRLLFSVSIGWDALLKYWSGGMGSISCMSTNLQATL